MGKKLRFWCKILTGRADGGAETLYIIYIDKEKPRRILFNAKKKLSEYLYIIKILCIFAM